MMSFQILQGHSEASFHRRIIISNKIESIMCILSILTRSFPTASFRIVILSCQYSMYSLSSSSLFLSRHRK